MLAYSAAVRTSRLTTAIAAGILATTALAGCSTETVDEASSAYCEQIDNLRSELESLRALVATDATVDEVNEQRDAVRDAYDATVSASENLDEAVSNEASGAQDSFEGAVGDIPTDVPVSEAAGQYTEATDAYVTELASIATQAGCS